MHWLLTGWILCLPTFAVAVAVWETFDGHVWALGFILGSLALLQIRLRIRRRIADLLLPHVAITAAGATITFAQWAWPLIHLVHLGAFLASLVGRRFAWAGIDYRLHGRTVSVERRPDVA
jgi:hypothetical protein